MSYKSIATILHDSESPRFALEMAISFARKTGAHLHVLCIGVDDTDPGYYYAGAQAIAVQQNFEVAQGIAGELEGIARARLAAEDFVWDVQNVTTLPGGLDPFLTDSMRFFDLIVLPAPYQNASNRTDTHIFEACLFGADRPILVVPEGAKTDAQFEKLIIGWDDGTPAMNAARAAIPLIASSKNVEITVIDPSVHAPDRSDPGGRIAAYLARFGSRVDVAVFARSQPSIANQLLMRAKESGADLMIMGAYGHSPMREAILGGATRDMLRATRMPVFMAH